MNDHRIEPDGLDDDIEPSDELRLKLRTLLDQPEDLSGRTARDLDRTLRGRSVLSTGMDLLGLGLRTAQLLLTDPTEPADQDREGR